MRTVGGRGRWRFTRIRRRFRRARWRFTRIRRRFTSLEEGDRIIEPEELHQRAWISPGILAPSSDGLEHLRVFRILDADDAPPRGQHLEGGGQVALPYNKRRSIDDLPIEVDLRGQTPKAVTVRFDLVAVDGAVHHRQVDSYASLAEPELLDDHGVWFSRVLAQQAGAQRRTNICVSENHRRYNPSQVLRRQPLRYYVSSLGRSRV
jgi:hypothetical protein